MILKPEFVSADLMAHLARMQTLPLPFSQTMPLVITSVYFSKASHLASHILHTQIMNALLDKHTRFTFLDEAQQTPLHLAAYCGRYEQVDVLARRVASGLNERDEQGRTPLHNAVMNGHR